MPDQDRDAVLAAFLESVPETVSEETAPETAPEGVESAPEPAATEVEAEAALESSQPAVEAAPAKEPEARAYRKLLDGEAKLRAERKAFEAERQQTAAKLAQWEAAQNKAKADPIGFLMANGLSDKEVLEALQEAHARDLGNLAPPEVRAQLAAKRAERVALEAEAKVEAKLKAEAEARARAEGEAYVARYQAGLGEYVATSLKEYPQLSAMAAAGKPVVQAMYQTAVEMAAANPNGPAPTYSDVAKQLNARLVELASFVAPAPTVTAPSADPQPSAKPVLRNSSTQAQPSPAPDAKPKSYNEYKEELRSRVLAAHGIAPR